MPTLTAPPATVDDDAAIQKTLRGNRDAFASLILKYKDSLFDMACRILGNRADAEDVLQDAFLEAYRHLASFRHKARFSTWLYSIVLNRVRNRLRRNKTIHWYPLDVFPTGDQDSAPLEMPDLGPSVPRIVDNRLALEAIQKAVETLPVDYRSIFILHYMQNLPLQDIAIRLGRPTGTVKVYLHRARKLLYRHLSKDFQLNGALAA